MIDVYSWPTPNGHKVHIMLEECGMKLGRDWQAIPINIGSGDQFVNEEKLFRFCTHHWPPPFVLCFWD